jgi:hypothetical protein
MTPQKALIYRVGAGKAIGFAIGILAFYLIPYFISDASLIFRSAVLLWYPTLGAIVGVFGIFSYHPVLSFPMPWWLRGAIVGAWMNFVLTLFAYQQICTAIVAVMGEYSAYVSPFVMVIEGALVGALIDFLLTHWFGEGWADKLDP